MPVYYSPDIRIRELEKLLQKKNHLPDGTDNPDYLGLWTKKELAQKVSMILDLKKCISEKTIENDLKKMELDYNAPIDKKYIRVRVYRKRNEDEDIKECAELKKIKDIEINEETENADEITVNKIAYFYYDKNISIFNNNNLQPNDLRNLRTIISMLEQFKGFKYFEDVSDLIDKLKLKTVKSENSRIFFETVDNYSGLDNIDIIARAVRQRFALKIIYKAFYESTEKILTIHPYQLREFNNRWFVLASTNEYNKNELGVYSLDRIVKKPVKVNIKFNTVQKEDIDNYFKDIIGVTNYKDEKVQEITFKVIGLRARYVETKPWHPSQQIIKEDETSKTFRINVKINNELIAKILSFGNDIKIIKPEDLKQRILDKLQKAINVYK